MSDLSVNRERRTRSKTETFEIAISGLLTRRADVFGELGRLHERMIELEGELAAFDRVLASLGYVGDLEVIAPARQFRDVPFKRGQVARAIRNTLRKASEPLTPRQIAQTSLPALGYDRDDDVPLGNIARRVSQCLQRLKRDGAVTSAWDGSGNAVWSLLL